ncbi:MAG: zinc metallopeptidase [Peptostreptococcaceae bacterium]|nr:zinc metallopeptidase [Peptostreptococcaceae bacterium]
MFLNYYSSMIFLIPAIIFAMAAQGAVKRNFEKYSKIRNQRNLSGAEAARRVLDQNGLSSIQINKISGNLTDNYNPRNKTLNLSSKVYEDKTISSVSIACHEVGHAIQHANNYVPLMLRNGIVPVVNIASKASWPLIFIGIILSTRNEIGGMLFNIGVITFIVVIIFHLITLPVELNASNRAIRQMEELYIVDEIEIKGSKKVLRAAAMTYVAALAVAAANLIRILAIRGSR